MAWERDDILRKAFGYNRVREDCAQHLLEGGSHSPALCNQQGKQYQKEHLKLGMGEKPGLGLEQFYFPLRKPP